MPIIRDQNHPGRILAGMRADAGLAQGDWAARLGVSAVTVSRWEVGARAASHGQRLTVLLNLRDRPEVDVGDLQRLARAWGIEPESLGILPPAEPEPEPAPEPPPLPPVDARPVMDAALLAAAEDNGMHVAPLRRALSAVLEAIDRAGVALPAARAALVK